MAEEADCRLKVLELGVCTHEGTQASPGPRVLGRGMDEGTALGVEAERKAAQVVELVFRELPPVVFDGTLRVGGEEGDAVVQGDRHIVVAADDPRTSFSYQVYTRGRIRAVAYEVSKAIDSVDGTGFYGLHGHGEGFQVGMDI